MANVSHLITIGLGDPAGIPEILTFGLQIGEAVAVAPVPLERTFFVSAEGRIFVIGIEERVYAIPEDDKAFSV